MAAAEPRWSGFCGSRAAAYILTASFILCRQCNLNIKVANVYTNSYNIVVYLKYTKTEDAQTLEATKSRKPRNYVRSRKTRKLIIENATELFIAEGYHKTTIEKIKDRSNVGYGTVFKHYEGKDGILSSIVADHFHDFFDYQSDLKALKDKEQLITAYKEFTLRLFELAREQSPILKVYQDAMIKSDVIANHWELITKHLNTSIADLFAEYQGSGLIRGFDVFAGAKIFSRLLVSIFWDIANEKEEDPEDAANTAVDVIFQGILK